MFVNRKLDTSSGYETDIEVNLLTGPPRHRRRRDRTQFSQRHLSRLEAVFLLDRYPDIHTRESLADEMGVTEDRIQVWFQNRRSKLRRRLLKKPAPLRPSPDSSSSAQSSPSPTTLSPPGAFYHTRLGALQQPSPTTTAAMLGHAPPFYYPQFLTVLPTRESPVTSSSSDRDSSGVFVPRRPWETPSPKKRQANISQPSMVFPGTGFFSPTGLELFPGHMFHTASPLTSLPVFSSFWQGAPPSLPVMGFPPAIHGL